MFLGCRAHAGPWNPRCLGIGDLGEQQCCRTSKSFLLLLASQRLFTVAWATGLREQVWWIWAAAIKIIDCDVGLECISAEMGDPDSNCRCTSASSLGGKDLGQDFLPRWAMGRLIVQREQLFFEKQAHNFIHFSAISPDSDRYRPSLTPVIRSTEGDHLRKSERQPDVSHDGGRPHVPILKWTIRWHCFETLPPNISPDTFYTPRAHKELPLKSCE